MIKYVINSRDPKDFIEQYLDYNQEDIAHFCRRTLEWSIDDIIKNEIFDKIIISYEGQMVKSMIDDIEKNSKFSIDTLPTNRYFCRLIDEMLFGQDDNFIYSCDLRKYLNNNDKIFVAHMDAFYDKSVYESMIGFSKPVVSGVNDYICFNIDNSYYRWLADFMILGSVEFLRQYQIKFSWNSLNTSIKNRMYNLLGNKNIFINNKHIEKIANLDGLQDGSMTLGILQKTGQISPLDVIDIGDGNIETSKSTHLKGFFSRKTIEDFNINNIILESVLFGRIEKQKEKLKVIQDKKEYVNFDKKVLSCYNSYFGQQILNNQEKRKLLQSSKWNTSMNSVLAIKREVFIAGDL